MSDLKSSASWAGSSGGCLFSGCYVGFYGGVFGGDSKVGSFL